MTAQPRSSSPREEAAKAHGLTPRARVLGMASAAVAPRIMGIGPVPSTRKLMERLGLKIGDFDLIELNEAFASQALACLRQLGVPDDAEHVNPHGGAIALGHPLGMSGARLAMTAVHRPRKARRQACACHHVRRRRSGSVDGAGTGLANQPFSFAQCRRGRAGPAFARAAWPRCIELNIGCQNIGEPCVPMSPGYVPFHPNPSKPKFKPPAGAVDAHCHVFGPESNFPYALERKYTPCDAPKEKLFALRDFLGFDKNVIVQASCHSKDNRAMVDALEGADGRAKGVAFVGEEVTDAELKAMDKAGVRGVRFNFLKRLVDFTPRDVLERIAARVEKLGWHIVVYFEMPDLPELEGFFTSLPTDVVVDHMGTPDVKKGVDHPENQRFHRLMEKNKNFWVKATCPERLTLAGPPYDDVVPFGRALVETFSRPRDLGHRLAASEREEVAPDDGCSSTTSRGSRRRPSCKKRCWSTIPCGFTGGSGPSHHRTGCRKERDNGDVRSRPRRVAWRMVLAPGVAPARWQGHEVFTPTLTGVGERSHLLTDSIGLDTHILDVVNEVKWQQLSGIVLVGHSYGGLVISGAAEPLEKDIASFVLLDAFLAEDGQSLADFQPQAFHDGLASPRGTAP